MIICGITQEGNKLDNEEVKQYIEAIKLAAGTVQYRNLSVKKTFMSSVSQLYKYYTMFLNKKYLETAVLHINAYLEMGFAYEDGKELFDSVLDEIGTTKELQFPSKFYVSKEIKLNKTQVRGMIKKWSASPHQTMKIDELVDDIIVKVREKQVGIFYYKCVVTNDVYELVISSQETFFHDLQRGIFYTFKDV